MARRKKARGARPERVPAAPSQASSSLSLRYSLIIFGVALLLRLIVMGQLSDVTLFAHPQLDSLEYLEWAHHLDGWPNPPLHGPGYPFFLGVLLAIDDSLTFVRVIQSILGALGCVLVASASGRFFGRMPALVTGSILALYGPLIFIDTSIAAESLLLFVMACILAMTPAPSSQQAGATREQAVVTGLLIGVATIIRPTSLVLLPIYAVIHRRRALPFIVAALIPIIPVAIANWRTTHELIPVQAYSGMNFYLGNSPHRSGLPEARLGGTWDALEGEAKRSGATSLREEDRYFSRKALHEIGAEPLAYGKLLATKTLWLVGNEEVRDSHSFYFFASQSFVLRWLIPFSLLFALAAAGFVVDRPRVLVIWLLAFAATCVFLVVGMRYRMPLVPVLAMFAGAAVRLRGRRELAIGGGLFLAALVVSHLQAHPPSHEFAEEWALSGSSLVHEHDLDGAETAYRAAAEADSKSALAWDGLGVVAFNRGRITTASENFERAIALNPEFSQAHYHLGLVYLQQKRVPAAIGELEEARRLHPDDRSVRETLAEARAMR
jgi:tetratricopeptide (TPR) repeat protein